LIRLLYLDGLHFPWKVRAVFLWGIEHVQMSKKQVRQRRKTTAFLPIKAGFNVAETRILLDQETKGESRYSECLA